MKLSHLALVVTLSAVTAFGLTKYATPTTGPAAEAKKETAFERVMRTGTIRCAYPASVPPRFVFDPNTKEKSGVNYEIVEAIGKALHLKIDWTEEVGYATFPENLSTGKEDMFCSTVWTSAARAHKALLTSPLFYIPLFVFVRNDVPTYDHHLEKLNNEAVSFSVMDGTTLEAVAKSTFPKATLKSLPAGADHIQPILDVASGKADAVVYDQFNVLNYNRRNPDTALRQVLSDAPIRTYGESFAVAMGEWELREMINSALSELQHDGTIDAILRKYESEQGYFLRTQDPFRPSKQEK
ncbi:MAG: amino acid ABC transporter substrate-binding protein [Proteobacteria bacterium]|jgi:ABC-type amino acid transport substrate-binding protein|nr:transporter substrate-binding domain-containing protein [Alphaproteobacteria bacterium]MDX9690063.1 transporter substrate-binding domain-containing protein [Alphaproteobacteria bacterium]NCC03510.1 amino acid ABC transporter substrate-binding protein [Pseudomonadota bacterium]